MVPSLRKRSKRYINLPVGYVLVLLVAMEICKPCLATTATLAPTSTFLEMDSEISTPANTAEMTTLMSPNVTSYGLPTSVDPLVDSENSATSNTTEMTTPMSPNVTSYGIPTSVDPLVDLENSTTSNTTQMTTPKPPKVTNYRLPTAVYPLHYDVEIQPYMHDPDPRTFTFRGSVKILVRCDNVTDNITLHAKILTVDPSSIRFSPETPSVSADPTYVRYEEDKERQFFIIRLDKNMEAGNTYWIEMNFTSPMNNESHGFYSSNSSRGEHMAYVGTTQLEATHARKAFPCFDEPAMKATFNMTIVRPANRISLSNMPIDNSQITFEEDGRTYVKDVYQQTPKMSPSLLAFVVSDFLHLASQTKHNVTIRAWAKPELVNDTKFALELGVKLIDFFEDYFDIRYPLPKLDMVAVEDFPYGAMENWGLVIFRNIYMLHNEAETTKYDESQTSRIIAHEIAHMWIGNLVTPSWWNEAWLKEAFCSYFEHFGIDNVHPEWKTFEMFSPVKIHIALDYDNTVASRPMYTELQTPDEIAKSFTYILYQKGATIVRMMQSILGENTFRNGLKNYLKNRLYSTATEDDLWDELTAQAKADGLDIKLKDIMDPWIRQMNYPVVTIIQDFNDNNSVQATQERFLSDPTATDPGTYKAPYNYRWSIPLTFASSRHPVFSVNSIDVHWLYKEEHTKIISVRIPLANCVDRDSWILANVQQYGYYRVNYHIGNWLSLSRQLKRNHSVIALSNRAQIITDAWALAQANYIPLSTALATIEYLHNETDYIPWRVAHPVISILASKLPLTPLIGAFQKFIKDKMTVRFGDFGILTMQTNPMNVLFQSLIADLACYSGVESCLNEASIMYRRWSNASVHQRIDVNIRDTVYCYGIAAGDQDDWEYALRVYNESESDTDKDLLISAMASTRNESILNGYLNLLLENENPFTKKEQALKVVTKVVEQSFGRRLAWNFYKSKYTELTAKFDNFYCNKTLSGITKTFNTKSELNEVTAFWENQCQDYDKDAFETAVLCPIKTNIKWLETNSPIIKKWLEDAADQSG